MALCAGHGHGSGPVYGDSWNVAAGPLFYLLCPDTHHHGPAPDPGGRAAVPVCGDCHIDGAGRKPVLFPHQFKEPVRL